jgi:hypothetical protein
VVREAHTRDTGCVEVLIKEQKRLTLDARSASSLQRSENYNRTPRKQNDSVIQRDLSKLLLQ